MAPKLYVINGSPPVAAVRMCAKLLGLELELETVNLINGDQLKEEYIQKNPQHSVPLLDDEGFLLPDSHAINAYLVSTYGKENDSLYPSKDLKRRALIDHRLYLDASIVAARGLLVSRPLCIQNIKPTQVSLYNLRDGFSILDKQIEVQNTKYIVGDVLSIADFSITTTVTGWGFFLPNWEKEFTNLEKYIERMKKEEWFDVNEEGLKLLHNLFGMKMKQFE